MEGLDEFVKMAVEKKLFSTNIQAIIVLAEKSTFLKCWVKINPAQDVNDACPLIPKSVPYQSPSPTTRRSDFRRQEIPVLPPYSSFLRVRKHVNMWSSFPRSRRTVQAFTQIKRTAIQTWDSAYIVQCKQDLDCHWLPRNFLVVFWNVAIGGGHDYCDMSCPNRPQCTYGSRGR